MKSKLSINNQLLDNFKLLKQIKSCTMWFNNLQFLSNINDLKQNVFKSALVGKFL